MERKSYLSNVIGNILDKVLILKLISELLFCLWSDEEKYYHLFDLNWF